MEREIYTKKRTTIKLSGEDIIELLKESGQIDRAQDQIGSISFTVPGGGDWSGMNVDIDKNNTVNISYDEISSTEV